MAVKKKKRLPKDLSERLRNGASLEDLQAVFDSCDVNATDGTSGRTALMLYMCPVELMRWLVANGADVNAVDQYGNTALHHQARSHVGELQILIDLGGDIHVSSRSLGTPLHDAVDAKKINHVETLLAAGADVNAKNREGYTPLEVGLHRASNIDLSALAPIARMLLESGAHKVPAMREHVRKLGENFEFHRSGSNPEFVDSVSAGLEALYEMFDVSPVAGRLMHDGQTTIVVTSTSWQDQFSELWNLLIPSSGPARTIQGEVVRIAGRVNDEINRNGGANWNADYRKMLQAFQKHVRSAHALNDDQLALCDEAISSLPGNGDEAIPTLMQLAVAWVLLNPGPMPLGDVPYRR